MRATAEALRARPATPARSDSSRREPAGRVARHDRRLRTSERRRWFSAAAGVTAERCGLERLAPARPCWAAERVNCAVDPVAADVDGALPGDDDEDVVPDEAAGLEVAVLGEDD